MMKMSNSSRIIAIAFAMAASVFGVYAGSGFLHDFLFVNFTANFSATFPYTLVPYVIVGIVVYVAYSAGTESIWYSQKSNDDGHRTVYSYSDGTWEALLTLVLASLLCLLLEARSQKEISPLVAS
jgi:cytochrome bd-type quinol oxidase subunit 2